MADRWAHWIPGVIGNPFRINRAWKQTASKVIDNCRQRDVSSPFLESILTATDTFLGRKLNPDEIAEESMGILSVASL